MEPIVTSLTAARIAVSFLKEFTSTRFGKLTAGVLIAGFSIALLYLAIYPPIMPALAMPRDLIGRFLRPRTPKLSWPQVSSTPMANQAPVKPPLSEKTSTTPIRAFVPPTTVAAPADPGPQPIVFSPPSEDTTVQKPTPTEIIFTPQLAIPPPPAPIRKPEIQPQKATRTLPSIQPPSNISANTQ
jgi:hypothetical protein